MRVFLHSDNAERQRNYTVTVSPAGDTDFVAPADVLKEWALADGRPKQIEVHFKFGAADVPDELGKYMVAREIAHRTRLLRKVRQLFNAKGEPLGEVFDAHGIPVVLDRASA